MSSYPPPPSAWGSSVANIAANPAPQDSREALVEWARHRGYQLSETPSLGWYQRWAPLIHIPNPADGRREVRAEFGEAKVWLLEAIAPTRPGGGPEVFIVSFVTSPALLHRAAIRSRIAQDAIEEMRTPFNPGMTPRTMSRWRWREREKLQHRTYGRSISGVIGDSVFEAQFEVVTPSQSEGQAALTPALRRFLVQGCWQGCIELRPGGMVVGQYRPPRFDPDSLDVSLWLLGQIYHAATAPPELGGSLPASSIRGAKSDPVDPVEMYGPPSGVPRSGR
jgi:hypothetical protein